MAMNNLLLFVYESGICMAALFGIYWVFLRKETYFQFNRLFLLSTIILACLIPLGNFSIFENNYTASSLGIITGMGEAVRLPEALISGGSENSFSLSDSWQHLAVIIYLLGASLILVRIFVGLIRISKLRVGGKEKKRVKIEGK